MTAARPALDDRYAQARGRVPMSGTHALVRLPMLQHERDRAAGLDTACFITGYRGSPLGGLDLALWQARRFTESHAIHFSPAVNEDLGATAVLGSQQTDLFDDARVDGVFAMLYAKGPGIDRSGDALKHGNTAGTARHGGVLVLAGDDHTCQSSTLAHQSEFALVDAMLPVLHPAGAQELLELGLAGWAMSRFSGLWVGMKLASETVDTTAVVTLDPERPRLLTPEDAALPAGGVHIRWPDGALEKEERQHRWKLDLALAFARANRLDRIEIDGRSARLGIVTVGKSYLDVRQALDELDLDAEAAASLRLLKVAMPWPLEPEGLRAFAAGLDEILVVEEKRALIEPQIRDILYALPRRPAVLGKRDENGAHLLPSWDELEPARIAAVIADRLGRLVPGEGVARRAVALARRLEEARGEAAPIARTPYFCSGCPHNSSTRVPAGSEAFAGIGCHFLVQGMERDTATFTHMGAEGANWIGLAPFRRLPHVFVNIGDGTYVHSGIMAIRAAIAAGVNVTYKILYNDAVALTGGQPPEGRISVRAMTHQLHGEGAARIAVVSDDPARHGTGAGLAAGVTLHHRRELDGVQRRLRRVSGVTVIIYDQLCATEKRRRRKRGRLADPGRRVVVNEAVCEGCGDCGATSNCLSVVPVETEFGRKRQIDQSSCNGDFTCRDGFCPSFVTLEGARPRRGEPAALDALARRAPPEPEHAPALEPGGRSWSILIAGVGGTGVVTLAQLLAWAAHIDGKGAVVLDQIGLAQKYGGVTSHVRLAASPDGLHASRIGIGGADVLLACDLVQAADSKVLARCDGARTATVLNDHAAPTGDFTRHPDMAFPGALLEARIARASARLLRRDTTRWAARLLGDSIGANVMLLGLAWQSGLVPLSRAAVEQAIALNGVAVEANLAAFRLGRLAASEPEALDAAAAQARPEPEHRRLAASFEERMRRRVDDLARYQNAAYGRRYAALVERVAAAEARLVPGRTALAEAAARNYHKLLAYKDEYEVARLLSAPEFLAGLAREFEGAFRPRFHLAPPLLARPDAETGRPTKRAFGPWILPLLRLLARLKGLRGTPLDPFAHTAERRRERALIADYEADMAAILASLTPANHGVAVELARVPESIRGYGPVKTASIEAVRERAEALRGLLTGGETAPERVAAQ